MKPRNIAIGAMFVLAIVVAATVTRQGGPAEPLPGHALRYLGEQRGIAIGTAVRGDVPEAKPRLPRARRRAVLVADARERDEVGALEPVARPLRLRPRRRDRRRGARRRAGRARAHARLARAVPGLARELGGQGSRRGDARAHPAGRWRTTRDGSACGTSSTSRSPTAAGCGSRSSLRRLGPGLHRGRVPRRPRGRPEGEALHQRDRGREHRPEVRPPARGRARAEDRAASRSTASASRCTRTCAACPRLRRERAALQGAGLGRRDHRGRRRPEAAGRRAPSCSARRRSTGRSCATAWRSDARR